MTCEASQAPDWQQTEFPWMSFAEGSPARTSALQERAQDWPASGRGYGAITPDLLARYDPASSSWRTSQHSLLGGLETFSETWPRSGMMRNGTAFRLQPLAPLTGEIGSGLLATPTTKGNQLALSMMKHPSCRRMAALRTPNAGSPKWRFSWQELGGSSNPYRGTEFGALKIHPWEWEWMMGFPKDWTACEPSATR